MRPRVDRLADQSGTGRGPGDGHVPADQPADRTAGPGSRAALLERLRSLAPGHASAVPRDRPGPAADQRAGGEPEPGDSVGLRGDSAGPRGDGVGLRGFDTASRRFWDQAGHFRSVWATHLERWPRPAGRDRSRPDDPPGTWRGKGDRHLSPDENAQAGQVIGLLQECEPVVTDLLRRLGSQSPFGARLVGLEHRRKGQDRLKEKIADGLDARLAPDFVLAASKVSDAVRYTYCLDAEQYAAGYADIHERLESAGYRMTFRANRWIGDLEYRGMNTRWLTPEGDRFELQFHTPESFFAKELLTHEPYERIRDPETTMEEEQELLRHERLVCAAIPEPDGVGDIPDVRPR